MTLQLLWFSLTFPSRILLKAMFNLIAPLLVMNSESCSDPLPDKTCSAGLKCRPVEDTPEPLLEWDRNREKTELKVGLTTKQELAQLLL
jgi:hypothetical protein